MPPKSSGTRSGAPRLSEVARKVAAPKGAVTTGWPAVRRTCSQKLGIEFDPWQDQVGGLVLAKRKDGSLASTIDGVGLSLPRQVGKTYLIASMMFALCVNTPGLLVIWTAHHMATSSETFLALQGFARRAKVAPHVAKVYTGSGDEEVRFHNGSRILFGARERGFGRGIPGVDVLIFDEAQILSDKAMSNMLATMNTSRFGLHLYIGTPPKPEDMSETFTRMRTAAYAGTLSDGAWVEFGADKDAEPGDRKQWAKMNPSYPTRTPAQSILRLQRKLTPDDFRREAMGIWDEGPGAKPTIDPADWADCHVDVVPSEGQVAYGVKYSVDGSRIALAAALRPEGDHPPHVEVVKVAPMGGGDMWVVEWLEERLRDSVGVVIDGKAGVGPLVNELRRRRIAARLIKVPSTDDVIAAHAGFLAAVEGHQVTHYGQAGLNAVVETATKRAIGKAGGWGWDGIDGTDTTPLDAATLAHWLVTTKKAKKATGGRKAVVL